MEEKNEVAEGLACIELEHVLSRRFIVFGGPGLDVRSSSETDDNGGMPSRPLSSVCVVVQYVERMTLELLLYFNLDRDYTNPMAR